jgi:2-phosphosulfolactate phosphatase
MNRIHVLLTPAELPGLGPDDLDATLCVVFDVLRATSSFVTALYHGAKQIVPVGEIAEALAWRRKDPTVLLAGERDGVKIGPPLTGGVQFDLGNSPREFVPENVRDRVIVSTTTNGTRALNACRSAPTVLAGSFLNLTATARFILRNQPQKILLVCAGTGSQAALEDILCAGALCQRLSDQQSYTLTDAAALAWRACRQAGPELADILSHTDNGRRLMAIPELRDDVAFCTQRDVFDLVAAQKDDGLIRITPQTPVPAGAG